MKSMTSLFNPTLYRKTMTRFWPMWAGYALLLLFMLPLDLVNDMAHLSTGPMDKLTLLLELTTNLPGQLVFHNLILMMGAALCAMAVYGYLFNNRSACMMHALPMRRDTLFITQYLAGLSFMLLPILSVCLVMLAAELVLVPSAYWSVVLPSLGTLLLTMVQLSIFYFSLASLCAMLTGHMLALPVFYGVCNMLAIAVYSLCSILAQQFFFGMTRSYNLSASLAYRLSPVFCLAQAADWYSSQSKLDPAGQPVYLPGHLNSASTIAIYTLVGLGLALAALAIYRRRHIESAGDVVSVQLVRPLFKIGVSFCTGLFLGVLTSVTIFWNDLAALCVLVVLWSVVGWFAAEMLLQKSFRVFRRCTGCAVMAGVMALLCACCYFDWFGVETRVPAPEDVNSATIRLNLGVPYDAGEHVVLSLQNNPRLMEDFVALHRSIVENRPQDNSSTHHLGTGDSYTTFEIYYTLKNGRSMSRAYYNIPLLMDQAQDKTSITGQFQALIQNQDLVRKAYDFDRFAQMNLVDVQLNNLIDRHTGDMMSRVSLTSLNGQQRTALWQAVQQDFAEGNLGRRFLFDNSKERYENSMYTDLKFGWLAADESPSGTSTSIQAADEYETAEYSFNESLTITLSPRAVHTLSLLEEYNALGDDYQLVPYQFDHPDSPGYVDPERIAG